MQIWVYILTTFMGFNSFGVVLFWEQQLDQLKDELDIKKEIWLYALKISPSFFEAANEKLGQRFNSFAYCPRKGQKGENWCNLQMIRDWIFFFFFAFLLIDNRKFHNSKWSLVKHYSAVHTWLPSIRFWMYYFFSLMFLWS